MLPIYKEGKEEVNMCIFFARQGASPRRKMQCHLTLKITCHCKYWSNKEPTNFFFLPSSK